MRRWKPQSPHDVARDKRLKQLAAAFAAFRRVHGRGQRLPAGLRRQFLAALDAGVPAGALGKACGVSWSQTRYWRSASAGGPVTAAPQVVSVVDRQAAPVSAGVPEDVLELRVGAWRISLQRVTD
jgi:hypothetical protein